MFPQQSSVVDEVGYFVADSGVKIGFDDETSADIFVGTETDGTFIIYSSRFISAP